MVEDCLYKLIVFGEAALRRAVKEYVVHYHTEHSHQGKDKRLVVSTGNRRKSPTHPYSVANDWVAYFPITIDRRHDGETNFITTRATAWWLRSVHFPEP